MRGDEVPLFEVLHAADQAACAAMRLVVHETYARNVYLDARDLEPEDFKTKPEGHTGGALNMVPAYVGYMAANAITGFTRSWIMGQGHTVAAIDSVNLLLGNMTEAHAERYSVSDEGLTRYVRDFYSYKLKPDGTQDSPLGSHVNARTDVEAAHHFNESARRLWVPPEELEEAPAKLQRHEVSGRPREKDHPLARRNVRLEESPAPGYLPVPEDRTAVAGWIRSSSMRAADAAFLAIVQANPHLRPRVGNPDEMKSNRMTQTLEALEFWVTDPEATIPEGIHGAVITALNEEAVASAALANKGGINIIVTYEAFGAKMHGEVRQEIIFANHQKEAGKPPRWLSVPLVLTSHAWENAKNEQSHQDPAMAEAMLGEPSDVSRVLFPADHNSATAVVHGAYETQGQIWTLVVPKGEVPQLFTPEEAERLLRDGALRLAAGQGRQGRGGPRARDRGLRAPAGQGQEGQEGRRAG